MTRQFCRWPRVTIPRPAGPAGAGPVDRHGDRPGRAHRARDTPAEPTPADGSPAASASELPAPKRWRLPRGWRPPGPRSAGAGRAAPVSKGAVTARPDLPDPCLDPCPSQIDREPALVCGGGGAAGDRATSDTRAVVAAARRVEPDCPEGSRDGRRTDAKADRTRRRRPVAVALPMETRLGGLTRRREHPVWQAPAPSERRSARDHLPTRTRRRSFPSAGRARP